MQVLFLQVLWEMLMPTRQANVIKDTVKSPVTQENQRHEHAGLPAARMPLTTFDSNMNKDQQACLEQ